MVKLIKYFIQKIINIIGFNITKIPKSELVSRIELKQKHINNLKVVLNREELLKYLPQNGYVAELGVDEGDFSKLILSINHPKELVLIDTWSSRRYNEKKMDIVKKKFKDEISSGKIKIIREKSEVALEQFKDNYFYWIYIDTAHTYEQTSKELEISRFKIKRGGIIAGHDYCQGSVEKAFHYGVIRAVNEFCLKYDWEIIYLTIEASGCLSFALKEIE